MVGPHDFGMDCSALESVAKTLGYAEIIDTPACILGAGLETVGPPGINACGIGIKIAEGIDKTSCQKSGKAVSFLVGKTGIFAVGLGIFQVNLLVSYIEISAEDHRLILLQLL